MLSIQTSNDAAAVRLWIHVATAAWLWLHGYLSAVRKHNEGLVAVCLLWDFFRPLLRIQDFPPAALGQESDPAEGQGVAGDVAEGGLRRRTYYYRTSYMIGVPHMQLSHVWPIACISYGELYAVLHAAWVQRAHRGLGAPGGIQM